MQKNFGATGRDRILTTGWLKDKPREFQEAILTHARILRYEPGSYTHHIGDEPGGFYGIIDGSFGVITHNAVSGTVMGHIMRRGDWFGQRSMVVGKPRSLAFRAMEQATAFYVSLQAVEKISQNLPEARWHFISLAEHNLEITIRIISDLLIHGSEKRIAAILLRIAGIVEEDHLEAIYQISLTQSDLAEIANVSRHVVNATVRTFESRGWISIGYGKVTILAPRDIRVFLAAE